MNSTKTANISLGKSKGKKTNPKKITKQFNLLARWLAFALENGVAYKNQTLVEETAEIILKKKSRAVVSTLQMHNAHLANLRLLLNETAG